MMFSQQGLRVLLDPLGLLVLQDHLVLKGLPEQDTIEPTFRRLRPWVRHIYLYKVKHFCLLFRFI